MHTAGMKTRSSPFCLGIAGGSGSGKTYLAKSVAQTVGEDNVGVLSMDRYFVNPTSNVSRQDINFDHPAHLDFSLMIDQLNELKNGRAVKPPVYDFGTMTSRQAATEFSPKPVLIVEGLFVLAKPMVDDLDLSCFLDVEPDQRLLGRLLRDKRERNASLEEIADRYQRFVRPSYDVFVAPTRQNADVVVDFTYRRILFGQLMAMLVGSYVCDGLDIEDFKHQLKAECNHLGFTPRDGSMPVSIDIFELARAYPDSVFATPALSH